MSAPMKDDTPAAWLRLISDMLTDKRYDYRADFLRSVRDQVKKSGKITDGQKNAVYAIWGRA